MREQAQSLDRPDTGLALPQSRQHRLATFLVAIEEHVFLAREMIEHRHPADVGGGRDLVHRDGVEASFEEQARGDVGNALAGG